MKNKMEFGIGEYIITALINGSMIKCEKCKNKWFDSYHLIVNEDGTHTVLCPDCGEKRWIKLGYWKVKRKCSDSKKKI